MTIDFTGSQVGRTSHVYWGVDVASEKLDLAEYNAETIETFANDGGGIARLVQRISRRPAALIVVEATGGYQTDLVAALADGGLPVVVINPRQSRAFAAAIGELAKTDDIDARLLARYGHDVQPRPREIPPEKQRFLADLAARRRQLIAVRTAELNRRKQTRRPELIASLDAVLEVLDQQITALDEQLAQLIEADPQWQQQDEIIQSVPGVGAGTSRVLIADLPELGQLPHKPLGKLVGLAPLNRDSGKFRGKRMITGGRATVRCALYMAALSAIRCNAPIRRFYQHLRNAGKPFKLAITACMHKLLGILNALVRDHAKWRNPKMSP